MRSFKQHIEETVQKPKGEDEQRFVDKHIVDKKKHPVADDTQFTSKAKKAKRAADHDEGEDADVYEEVEEFSESVIDDLRKIVKTKSAGQVKFANGSKTKVDMFTASAMVKVHDALNKQNQPKFADSINKGEQSFMKMMDFAMSKVK